MDKDLILKEYDVFSRLCRLRLHFRNSDSDTYDPFRIPNPSWEPPIRYPCLSSALLSGLRILHNRIDAVDFSPKPRFSRSQLISLRKLRRLPIVIKPADKNLGIVVIDKDKYLVEGSRQLSDRNVYQPVATVPWIALRASLRQLQSRYRNLLSVSQWKYILQIDIRHARACVLYFIWKIQKNPPVGRPICSYNGFMLEPLSKLLHHKLLSTLMEQPNHLPDSLCLLQAIETERFLLILF
jgi:hypothetical protein